MSEDEKLVRDSWPNVKVWRDKFHTLAWLGIGDDDTTIYAWKIQYGPWDKAVVLVCVPREESSAWSAAAALTRARKQKIADVEEEITYMGFYDFCDEAEAARKRILGRLTEALADLKRGMKGGI